MMDWDKVNPGSNVHGDNKATKGTVGAVDIPEPIMSAKDTYQCPVCDATFSSRADYDSHFLARHQTPEAHQPVM